MRAFTNATTIVAATARSAIKRADLPSRQPSPTQARLGALATSERPHSRENADGRGSSVTAVDRASPLHPLADLKR
jgi:hypothetical protein